MSTIVPLWFWFKCKDGYVRTDQNDPVLHKIPMLQPSSLIFQSQLKSKRQIELPWYSTYAVFALINTLIFKWTETTLSDRVSQWDSVQPIRPLSETDPKSFPELIDLANFMGVTETDLERVLERNLFIAVVHILDIGPQTIYRMYHRGFENLAMQYAKLIALSPEWLLLQSFRRFKAKVRSKYRTHAPPTNQNTSYSRTYSFHNYCRAIISHDQ